MPINRHIPFRCLLPKILFVSRNSDYQNSVCLGIVVVTLFSDVYPLVMVGINVNEVIVGIRGRKMTIKLTDN